MIAVQSAIQKNLGMCRADAFFRYLRVHDETMSSALYVTGAGRAVIRPYDQYPPSGQPPLYQVDWPRSRTLPDYQLILVTDGAGEFESEATGHVRFEESAMLFVFPGLWHRFRPAPEVGWTERWFAFNGEAVRQLLETNLFGPSQAVTRLPYPERLAEQFDSLLNRIRDQSVRNPALLTFQALRIVSEALAQHVDRAIDAGAVPKQRLNVYRDDPVVQKALEIIWTHSSNPISVSDIARQLPVTRRTLDRRFVEATGHSVLEEINACRLSRARRLLVETDLPVKSVAHLAGFCSTERMRVLFIEREGKCPSEFRKSASEARGPKVRPQ